MRPAFPGSPLRVEVAAGEPAVQALGPFFHSIEVLIALLFFVPGVVYGVASGQIRSGSLAQAGRSQAPKDAARTAFDSLQF